MPVKKIPEGFHTLTPYLVLNDAANVVAFLKKAFNVGNGVRAIWAQ